VFICGFTTHPPHPDSASLIYDPQQMRNLRDNTPRRRRVRPRDGLVQLGDAKVANNVLLLLRIPDRASVILYLDRPAARILFFLSHVSISDCGMRISYLTAPIPLSILKPLSDQRRDRGRKSAVRNPQSAITQVPQPACREALQLPSGPSSASAR